MNTQRRQATELSYWLYSTGNFANNIIFLMVGTYITYFYTDILGIPAIMAGTIFMVARLVDAVTDPIMGIIVDRSHFKMGKFRPFIVAGAPFLGIVFVLLFTAPDFPVVGKIAYAFVTYIIYSFAWTIVQIPQLALPAILTNDLAKRTRIQAIFQAFGSIASLVITSWALPILDALGGQGDAGAWFKFTVGAAIVSVIIFEISAMSVKGIDVPDEKPASDSRAPRQRQSLGEIFSVITKNRALLCVLIAYGTDMFAFQISNSFRIYFFQNNMGGRTDLITYIGYATTIMGFAVVLFIQPLVKKTGKKMGIILMEGIAILFTLPMLITGLTGAYAISMVMFTYISISFTWTVNNMLSRAAVLDSANYAYVTTGVNGTALVNSTFTFINKCCQAFSMFFGGAILTATGYDASLEVQSGSCLNAILLMCTILPIAGYVASLVAMYFYPLNRKGEQEMEEKLNAMSSVVSDADLNI